MLYFLFWVIIILGVFLLNLFGMMNIVPKYISIPILFLTFFLFFYMIFQKHSYKRIK
ncbi:hypothetical protein SAMN05216498_3161 [Tenuibacillus multivorans]|uniref:Uncharacterized protein n=1 Tax=Tenuibacillus multivorans TaxID=237069 RepID=A0A1H0EI95_9BACI|nr:hypothetical protein SAMN05216498_3161 [Tenuibacillus multivorans]